MSESNNGVIRVGSRKSELALIQTNHVIKLLKNIYPEKKFEIITMNTMGDKVLDIALPKIGEKSLFTKELEAALATGGVDFVVHSLKDLPTCLPENMAIGVVLEREDPRDALVLHEEYKSYSLESLPKNSTIGTSSLRRAAQLHRYYPHLQVENIRGNLNTRLKKLDDLNKYQAIVLATAGLQRMGWHNRISKIIDEEELLYAVGQGAIAVECREKDEKLINILKPLYDIQTAIQIVAERTFLKTLGGGCSAPVAVKTNLLNVKGVKHKLQMTGAVWSLDGKDELKEMNECELEIIMNKCSVCPYKNCSSNGNNCTDNDIECIQTCSKQNNKVTIENEAEETSQPPNKKIKVDDETCPINLPIGADFMGKCPYLESKELDGDPVINVNINEANKCPFRQHGSIIFETEVKTDKNNQDLFCGLVPHPDVSLDVFVEAEKLGRDLANRLIENGAKDIMTKAQNIIKNC
ncbi:porphobilinogen deaminase [Holotrichia oblita]|uniref:Porphobilinogen deaminase n=1 Tax=Holotrichia oblita TaxID=644536 RepID=A0ACB9SLP3_HOLOL|nr:porphobilinogen deaminase [Holotrichia oblita]